MSLEQKINTLLSNRHETLAVAESCTGGLLAHRITNVPGSSKHFMGGIIAYSNILKIKLLKVPAKIVKRHGAVSEHVALAMARGAAKTLEADIGIGITGIAGPAGGTKTKPVGLVFIAAFRKDESICLHCRFQGSRQHVKAQAAEQALVLLDEILS